MVRRIKLTIIFLGIGISVFIFLAGIQFANLIYHQSSLENGRRKVINFTQPIQSNAVDDVRNFEQILNKTRTKIKFEFTKYNFSYSGVQRLEDLLMESGGRPMQNLIISSWRSGSTFFGQLLEAIPGTFYHYQPLLRYGVIQIRGPPESVQAVNDIKNIFKCNFYGMDEYFEYGKTDMLQFHNSKRLWDHCKQNEDLCFDQDFTSQFCKLFPFQTMKLCRLRLRFVQEFFDDEELNVKVILLIRDPRAVMNSRHHRNFCQKHLDCWQPELLCADMTRDYIAASRLLPIYPDKLMILRFEDLIMNPNATTHQISEFLKISAKKPLDDFLQSHMNHELPGVTSTFKISRNVPFKWKNMMDFNDVDEIQMMCKDAMKLWGYQMAHNATHMSSKEFNPIKNYTIS